MANIPNPKNYPEAPNTVHPEIAERRYQVQAERFTENYPGGRPLDEVLDPEKFKEFFDKV